MTNEQKDKLEQACRAFVDSWPNDFKEVESVAFFAGAQTILDNPSDFDLMCKIEAAEHLRDTDSAWEDALVELKDQNKRYREALERLYRESKHNIHVSSHVGDIAKEALKQEDTK